jgi:transporter family protein
MKGYLKMLAQNPWLPFALGSAFFAALVAILGKFGVGEINSNMATLIRVCVILLMTFGIVAVRRDWQPISSLSRFGLLMLVLSGIATGLSWLCYWRAMQLGSASQVAPVDKLSVVMVILLAALLLHEPLSWKTILGGALITAGTIVTAL